MTLPTPSGAGSSLHLQTCRVQRRCTNLLSAHAVVERAIAQGTLAIGQAITAAFYLCVLPLLWPPNKMFLQASTSPASTSTSLFSCLRCCHAIKLKMPQISWLIHKHKVVCMTIYGRMWVCRDGIWAYFTGAIFQEECDLWRGNCFHLCLHLVW